MKRSKTYKGIYKPTHAKKYIGNTNYIYYRSLWERRFMVYCDLNEQILYWSSEEVPVKYWNPITKRVHRYYPDFIIKTVKGKKYMIEIKPDRYTRPPKKPKRKSKSFMRESFDYIKNKAKWQAAEKYCDDNNMFFKIFTEKELGIK